MRAQYDVVVVGAGPAGMMAALKAADEGLQVLLLEKEAELGGTGRGSAYGVWIPQNPLLKQLGIKEDKTMCLRWMCKHAFPDSYDAAKPFNGIPELDYQQFASYFDHAGTAVDYLQQRSGVELVYMRNHAGDEDSYRSNRELLQAKELPQTDDLVRALPDYHPEDEDNQVPLGRYVNFRTSFAYIMLYFWYMFINMSAKVLISGLLEMLHPKKLWQVAKGFCGKNDEGAFYYSGAGLRMTAEFKRLLKHAKVDIALNTGLEEILFDRSNAVSGVRLKQKSGELKSIDCRNVIVTVGGFAHNRQLLKQHAPDMPSQRCLGRPSSDGHVMQSLQDRVQLNHLDNIWQTESLLEQALQTQGPKDIIGASNVWHINGDSAIVVDQNGQRCYDESKQYSMRSKWYRSGDKEIAIYVFDKRTIQRFGGLLGTWSAHLPMLSSVPFLRPSHILSGRKIDQLSTSIASYLENFKDKVSFDLAEGFGEQLQASIERYNQFAISGVDPDFNRGASNAAMGWRAKRAKDNHYPNKTMYPISDSGPYYAMVFCLSCFNTKGGLQTNGQAQVLDKQNQPIEGLYAAGNCTASPSNTGYVLSTIGPALTFGYLAAQHASQR